jgi:hypothetical protein
MEGKSILAGNIAKTLSKKAKKLYVELDGRPNPVLQQSKFPLITKILGYSDPRIDLNSPFYLNRLAILRNRISFLQDGSTIL